MRFKAKLASEHVSMLYSLITPISRLASSSSSTSADNGVAATTTTTTASSLMRNGCILQLDDQHVRLSIRGRKNSSSDSAEGIVCFCELQAGGGIFLDHRIESVAENNAIVMELDIVQLRLALQSIQQHDHHHKQHLYGANENATSSTSLEQQLQQHFTILKLAKRHNNIPCLCIDAYTKSSSTSAVGNGSIQVHHAIPVRICRPTEWPNHLPPNVPLPDIQLEVPAEKMKPLRTVMERLRTIAPTVLIKGASTGDLTISLDSDGVCIRTQFGQLIPHFNANSNANNENNSSNNHHSSQQQQQATTECTVKVDSKKLTTCLQWQQQSGLVSSALLCLIENEALVVHAMLNPATVGFFTYYVPVHFMSPDRMDD